MNSSNSNLDDIIMERLKSRQEKLSAIKEWQDKRHRKHDLLTGLIVSGMAASILFGIFTFKPFALQNNDIKVLDNEDIINNNNLKEIIIRNNKLNYNSTEVKTILNKFKTRIKR